MESEKHAKSLVKRNNAINYLFEKKNLSDYSVKYREMNKYVIKTLQEFLETSDEYAGLTEHAIPYHRIIEICENGKLIFSRDKKKI